VDGSPDCASQFSVKLVEVPQASSSVDILFVIDNSASMNSELQNLGAKFPKFAEAMADKNWQACLATTDWENEHGALHTWKNGSFLLNAQTPEFATVFQNSMSQVVQSDANSASNIEQGIRTAHKIFSSMGDAEVHGCLRADAAKAVIFVSDEDELSNGWAEDEKRLYDPTFDNLPQTLIDLVHARFSATVGFSAHAIAIKPGDLGCLNQQRRELGKYFEAMGYYARRYGEVVEATGGDLVSICESDFSDPLTRIGSRLGSTLASVDLGCANGVVVNSVDAGVGTLVPHMFSIRDRFVDFLPVLGPGEKAKIVYQCK
jgi:hypothetical protein